MTTKNNWSALDSLPKDLLIAKELVYDRLGLICSQPMAEAESSEYGACTFQINGMSVRYRVAKITPTKIGHFVTLWKRQGDGPIEPFDISDEIDLIVISTRNKNRFGQFIFPTTVLFEKGIISGSNKAGKRGIRVYPPWDFAANSQAIKTQQWQLKYFLEIAGDKSTDFARANNLFNLKKS